MLSYHIIIYNLSCDHQQTILSVLSDNTLQEHCLIKKLKSCSEMRISMHKQPEITSATRQKIIDAFWKEYLSAPITKITISAITKRAGVHRSTFYEYFNDIYDLLEQFENDLLEILRNDFLVIVRKRLSQLEKSSSSDDLTVFINSTLSFFSEYGDVLYHLSGPSGDPAFRKKLYQLFKINFMDMHSIPEDSPYAEFLSSFIFAIILNNLDYWFEHKDSITMQEVITLSYKLIGSNLSSHFFYDMITDVFF